MILSGIVTDRRAPRRTLQSAKQVIAWEREEGEKGKETTGSAE